MVRAVRIEVRKELLADRFGDRNGALFFEVKVDHRRPSECRAGAVFQVDAVGDVERRSSEMRDPRPDLDFTFRKLDRSAVVDLDADEEEIPILFRHFGVEDLKDLISRFFEPLRGSEMVAVSDHVGIENSELNGMCQHDRLLS